MAFTTRHFRPLARTWGSQKFWFWLKKSSKLTVQPWNSSFVLLTRGPWWNVSIPIFCCSGMGIWTPKNKQNPGFFSAGDLHWIPLRKRHGNTFVWFQVTYSNFPKKKTWTKILVGGFKTNRPLCKNMNVKLDIFSPGTCEKKQREPPTDAAVGTWLH